MMAINALLFSMFFVPEVQSSTLSNGELLNTAVTLQKGDLVIRPVTPSSYGLTDNIELKVNLWDFEYNENMTPWLGVEMQVLQNPLFYVSMEPTVILPQYGSFGEVFVGGYVHISSYVSSIFSFHLDSGTFLHRVEMGIPERKVNFVNQELRLSSNIQLTSSEIVRIYGRTQSAKDHSTGRYFGFQNYWSVGTDWNKLVHPNVRISLGMVVANDNFSSNQPGFGDHDIYTTNLLTLGQKTVDLDPDLYIYPTFNFWLAF